MRALAEKVFPDLIAEFVQSNLDFFNLLMESVFDDFFDGRERDVGTQLSQEAYGFRIALDGECDVL